MIREKRAGVWEVAVYLGRDPVTGKKRSVSRSVRGGRRDAEKLHARLTVEVLDRQGLVPSRGTVSMLLTSWLEHVAGDLSPTTLHGYRKYVRVHLAPALGDVELEKLTTKQIDDFYRELRTPGTARYARNLSATTIRHIHAVLRRALEQGVKWGWLSSNPAENASPPRPRAHEITPPAPGTLVQLLNEAERQDFAFGVVVWLAAVTGARRGELCALRWMNVDLEEATLTIARALVEDGDGVLHEKDTKTHQARRIAIDPVTVEILMEYRAHATGLAAKFEVELDGDAYLFTDADPAGRRPLPPARLSSRWRRLCERLDVDVRLHDLRHFAATQALAAGVPVRTVAGRLGHGGGGRTTLQVYAHFLEASDRDAAEQLGAVLQKAREVPAISAS